MEIPDLARKMTLPATVPIRASATRPTARKKGTLHCFFTNLKYSPAPCPRKPEVKTAQPQYTAHSSRAKV